MRVRHVFSNEKILFNLDKMVQNLHKTAFLAPYITVPLCCSKFPNVQCLTLPGIMDDPGSFSGRLSSPRPHLGPEPRNLMSLAIFMREQATTLHAPLTSTMASWEARASNLLGAVTKGRPVSSDTLAATCNKSTIVQLFPNQNAKTIGL